MPIKTPTRRDFIRYGGIGAGAAAFLGGLRRADGQIMQQPIVNAPFSAVVAIPTLGNHTTVANPTNGGNTGTLSTTAIDTTGASLLVLGFTTYSGAGAIVSSNFNDSQTNTWRGPNTITTSVVAGGCYGSLFWCPSPTTSASHVINLTATGHQAAIYFAAFTNVTPTYRGAWVLSTTYAQYDVAVDTSNSALYMCIPPGGLVSDATAPHSDPTNWQLMTTHGTASSSPTAAGSVTTLFSNTLVISLLMLVTPAGAFTVSVSPGNVIDHQPAVSSTVIGGALGYDVLAAAGAINPSWTTSIGTAMGAVNLFI